jgi:hypothetical protein
VHGNRVTCDHEGCEYFVEFQVLRPGPVGRGTELRPLSLARKEGWRIDSDGAFCPRHAEIWHIREV